MYHDSIDKTHRPVKLLNETEQYKKQVIPIKQRNHVYARRSQEYLKIIGKSIRGLRNMIRLKLDLTEKSSRNHLNRHRYEKESIEKDLTRIRYEKKHKSLFKKFHTREGLELANHDAFNKLLEIDKVNVVSLLTLTQNNRTATSLPSPNLRAYMAIVSQSGRATKVKSIDKWIGQSNKRHFEHIVAYQLLAKIERESEPEQIERRRQEDQYRQSYSSKLDHVRR